MEVPAVGISVGVSRLLAALDLMSDAADAARGPVVVLALEPDRMADYQAMAADCAPPASARRSISAARISPSN